MALEIKLPKEIVKITLSDDKVIEAPILDIDFTIFTSLEGLTAASATEKVKKVTEALNKTYGCNLTNGEGSHIMSVVREHVSELKKNITST